MPSSDESSHDDKAGWSQSLSTILARRNVGFANRRPEAFLFFRENEGVFGHFSACVGIDRQNRHSTHSTPLSEAQKIETSTHHLGEHWGCGIGLGCYGWRARG